ncbi:MAG: hypothetical protein ACO3NZ_13185 [Pirellulales bacterium]
MPPNVVRDRDGAALAKADALIKEDISVDDIAVQFLGFWSGRQEKLERNEEYKAS